MSEPGFTLQKLLEAKEAMKALEVTKPAFEEIHVLEDSLLPKDSFIMPGSVNNTWCKIPSKLFIKGTVWDKTRNLLIPHANGAFNSIPVFDHREKSELPKPG